MKEKKSPEKSVSERETVDSEKEVRAGRYPSRTSGDETTGERYGSDSPVVTKIR